jgi:outer membrane protein OmpA-like peptidoglycan-associated protein
MAFNLNKGDEPAPRKTSFDLSKTEPATGTNAPKKILLWFFALIGIAAIAAAAWYLARQGTKLPEPDLKAVNVPLSKDSTVKSADTSGQQLIAGNKTTLRNNEDPKQEDIPPASGQAAAKRDAVKSGEPNTPVIAASFRAGSASLQILSNTNLAGIRRKIRGTSLKINVLGYASSEGPLSVNQAISQARADAYKQFLVRNGIADSLVTAQGKGIENPVAPNDTEKGRKKNRRVEVLFQ